MNSICFKINQNQGIRVKLFFIKSIRPKSFKFTLVFCCIGFEIVTMFYHACKFSIQPCKKFHLLHFVTKQDTKKELLQKRHVKEFVSHISIVNLI